MQFLRFSDSYDESPGVDGLTDGAFRLHFRALSWSSRHATDGTVPRKTALRMGAQRFARELVEARVWDERPDGYVIVGFGSFVQAGVSPAEDSEPAPKPEGRDSEREATRRRVQRHRSRVTETVTDPVTSVTGTVTGGVTSVTETVTCNGCNGAETVTGGVTSVTCNARETVTSVTESVTGGGCNGTDTVTSVTGGVTRGVTSPNVTVDVTVAPPPPSPNPPPPFPSHSPIPLPLYPPPTTTGSAKDLSGLRARGKTPDPVAAAAEKTGESEKAEEKTPSNRAPRSLDEALRMPIADRARSVSSNEHAAEWSQPEKWPEVLAISKAFSEVFGKSGLRLGRYSRDSGVRALVELFSTGFELAELERVVQHLPRSEWWTAQKRGMSSLSPEVVRRMLDEIAALPKRDPEYQARLQAFTSVRSELEAAGQWERMSQSELEQRIEAKRRAAKLALAQWELQNAVGQ